MPVRPVAASSRSLLRSSWYLHQEDDDDEGERIGRRQAADCHLDPRFGRMLLKQRQEQKVDESVKPDAEGQDQEIREDLATSPAPASFGDQQLIPVRHLLFRSTGADGKGRLAAKSEERVEDSGDSGVEEQIVRTRMTEHMQRQACDQYTGHSCAPSRLTSRCSATFPREISERILDFLPSSLVPRTVSR